MPKTKKKTDGGGQIKIDNGVLELVRQHREKTGTLITFFIEQAIIEKLDRFKKSK